VSLAFPPVGWQSTVWQPGHTTTVWEWLNTVVMLKQPWHLTSMKKELGDWTRRFFLCLSFSSSAGGLSRSMSFWSTILEMPAKEDDWAHADLRCSGPLSSHRWKRVVFAAL